MSDHVLPASAPAVPMDGTGASPALIAAALAQLAEGVIVVNAAGSITFVNEAAARLHGVARLDVAPEDYADAYQLLREDGSPYPSEELPLARAVLRAEAVLDARWRIRRPDGSEITAIGSARPVVGRDGVRLGAVLTLRDDTPRMEAERRAARILERVADHHLTMDRDFRILTVNRAALTALGVPPENLVGRTHWEAFPASLGSEAERRYRRVAAEGVDEHFAHHYVGEGYDIHIEIDAYPTDDGGIALFWRDVSARMLAEQSLREQNALLAKQAIEMERAVVAVGESEARLRLAIEAAQMGTWTLDMVTGEGTFDARVRELFGFPGDDADVPLEMLFARVHPEDLAGINAAIAAAANPAGDGRYVVESRIIHPDGTERWAAAAGMMRFEGEGPARRAAALIGTVFDITDRRRAEAAVLESEAQLRTLADAIPTLAWTARADGYIDWYNARWYAYTGTTPAEMEGWGWQAVHDPATLPDAMNRWQAAIAAGEPLEITFPLRGADGQFRRFLTRVVPVRDDAGRVMRWFGTNTDVEVERTAREAAEAANQAKSEFLSAMSHELRTPLNAIAGYAELISLGVRGPVTEAQQEDLARLSRANQHLISLIGDVLSFARVERGQIELHVEPFEMGPLMADLEALVMPQITAKDLEFTHDGCSTDTPESPHVVRADVEKVRQILVNVLTNAVKFTERGGRITLACERDTAGLVRIRVTDSGRGIPDDALERIFEPFVQVNRHLTKDGQQGVGLGLAISRDLARAMGGELQAASTLGVGSTFTLTLPGG